MREYKTTLGKLYQTVVAISNEQELHDSRLPRKTALNIARNLKRMQNEVDEYELQRNELIGKYTDGGTSISPADEHWLEFSKELDELNNQEAVVNIYTITDEDIPEVVSLRCVQVLDFMIEFEDVDE